MTDPGYLRYLDPVVVPNRHYGNVYGNPFDWDQSYLSPRGYVQKDAAVKSDHRSSTPWGRSSALVVTDTPATYEGHWWGGDDYYVVHMSDEIGDGFHPYVPDSAYLSLDNAESRSLTQARERLRDPNSFSLGVAIGEARHTANLFAGTSGTMAGALLNFRRHANSISSWSARERALATAGAWLEGYYGWGSLARDAFSLSKKLNKKLKVPLTVSSKSWTKFSDVRDYHQTSRFRETSTVSSGGCLVKYQANIELPLAREFESWGITNPLSIAWELSSLSFVLDWFIPIGNVLSSLSATAGLSFADGASSRTLTCRSTSRYNDQNPYAPTPTGRGAYVTEVKDFRRRPMAAFALPQLYANENPFSTNRVISAVALITQAVLR